MAALFATGRLLGQDIVIPLPPGDPPAPARSAPIPPMARSAPVLPTPVQPAQAQSAPVQNVSFTPAARAVQPPTALTLAQVPKGPPKLSESEVDFTIRTDLPGADLLFRRESENQVFERIRQENTRPGGSRVIFPERYVTTQQFEPRRFPEIVSEVDPGYVAHRRLYFEQKNYDRYLWEVGYLQPAISTGRFFYDTVLLPYHTGIDPLRHWDASTGKCLPGDPTPLLCYGERFSVIGLTYQAAAVAGGCLVFP